MKTSSEHSNGETTIIWQPHLCQHSGICVKMLPEVYNSKEGPWVNSYNATTEQSIDQVNYCPSGALSFVYKKTKQLLNPAINISNI